jgi:hypothetical protein
MIDKNIRCPQVARMTILRSLFFVSLVAASLVIGPGRPGHSQVTKANLLIGDPFRISQASTAGADRAAASPDIAYNRDDNEYLVVWKANGLSGARLRMATEIFGQRINAATGAEIGSDFRISNMSDGGMDRHARSPQIVYNSVAREYLVVWQGSGTITTPDQFFEIYGQRLSRTGTEVGSDFRISNTTDLGKINTNFVRASASADVAWNSADNQYLVVWTGMGQPEDVVKLEVYGQLLTSNGEAIGKDFRISDTTNQGNNFHASAPEVAYNSTNNQYLIVWSGGFMKESQTEVWGQGLTAQGRPLGKGNGDFRISQINTSVGSDRYAGPPNLAHNSSNNEYFVVFNASGLAATANEVNEIYGQRIDAAKLEETGPQDFRISHTGGAKDEADSPRVAYDSLAKEYLVIWRGVRSAAPFEIFGQRLSLTGTEIETDFQVSNIAAVGKDRTVNIGSVAYNSTNGEYLTVWEGNGLPGPANKAINEIFGQRMKPSSARR